MITEWPETEVAKFWFLTPASSASRLMASTTSEESMIEPSTIASGDSGSTPTRSRWNSPLRSDSSTSLTAELPMSTPTTLLERDQNTDFSTPLET